MSFTDRLYTETKESHKVVDKHPFVSLIRKDKLAGDMYVNFNKLCIHEIQQILDLQDNVLQKQLYRNIDLPDIYITSTYAKLLKHCKQYPVESAYQFYLGLLFGGNMLKRMLPEHHEFLTYENSKELITEFKTYLCKHVSKVEQQEQFIQNVNKSYELIKKLFDEFYERCTKVINIPFDVQESPLLDGGPGTYPDPDTGLF